MSGILTNFALFEKFEKCSNQKSRKAEIERKLTEIEKKLDFLDQKEKRLAKLYSEGIIEIEVYKKEWQECKEEKTRVLKEKEELSQLLLTEEEKRKRIDALKTLYQGVKDRLEDASYEIKHQLIQWLVEKIIIKEPDLEIIYNLPFKESILNAALNGEINTNTYEFVPPHNERVDCDCKTFSLFMSARLLSRGR
jgi:hypothetical protein